MQQSRKGFTLVELLVVILIIGVLAAIALPMYQKAVLKSRFSAMMPIAKAMAESNEIYYLDHGRYSENPEELTIQGKNTVEEAYPDGTTILMYSNEEDLSFVRTENANIPNARYVVYQKHSKNFADTTWCEAGDERAEEMCVALGGVIPDGVSGNSDLDADWTAYLLSGQLRNGDHFGPVQIPCTGEAPADIRAGRSGATGTATCVNGQWKYQWTGGRVYDRDYSYLTTACDGRSNYECAGGEFQGNYTYCYAGNSAEGACTGSTFSGEKSMCGGSAVNGCADSTFSGERSHCDAHAATTCANSTFSGEGSYCQGRQPNGCAGSIFSGEKSYCEGSGANGEGCAGTTIQAGAYCRAFSSGGCNGAKYGEDPTGQRSGIGSCDDERGNCPEGAPILNAWNETNGSYDYTWKGGYCNPDFMVSGNCPAGSPKQGGGTW